VPACARRAAVGCAAREASRQTRPASLPASRGSVRACLSDSPEGWRKRSALLRRERRPILPDRDLASLLPTLGLKPCPYQWNGAEFLARTGRALLADEMGLGKTVQAILAATALRRASRPALSVTIVCPASLRGGWAEEIQRVLGEAAVLLEGLSDERARTIAGRRPARVGGGARVGVITARLRRGVGHIRQWYVTRVVSCEVAYGDVLAASGR
jgi:hypothetical protein